MEREQEPIGQEFALIGKKDIKEQDLQDLKDEHTKFVLSDSTGDFSRLLPTIVGRGNLTSITIDWCNLTSEHVGVLVGMKFITSLNLKNNSIGDEGLQLIINNMEQLTSLNVWNNNITSNGVRDIYRLKNLTVLDIYSNRLYGEGAVHLSRAVQLEDLDLGNNKVGNNGLTYIGSLINLRRLNIWNNRITIQGLEKLLKLRKLEHLNSDFDLIPDRSKWKLQNLFPKVKFPFDIKPFAQQQEPAARADQPGRVGLLYNQAPPGIFGQQRGMFGGPQATTVIGPPPMTGFGAPAGIFGGPPVMGVHPQNSLFGGPAPGNVFGGAPRATATLFGANTANPAQTNTNNLFAQVPAKNDMQIEE